MYDSPDPPTDPHTAGKLATWLAAHMARTRLSAADVARELGVSAATVRLWLREAAHCTTAVNEFAHLDSPPKLGAWLRSRIRDSGRSVQQIAATTDGVSMRTIYNWLHGEHLPLPPNGEEPDRFDLLLRHPSLELSLRQRVQLGVDPQAMPADPDALRALYHQTLAGRRLLIVLDNAHAEPQVRPLLPTEPTCLAVLTSRNRLDGLHVTHTGITNLPLDTLTPAEAASLVRNLLGRLATRATSDADIDAFAEACDCLPLAVQIAAANYLTHHHPHHVTVGEYTQTLTGDRLRHLTMGTTDPATAVTATMDHSYRHLTDGAQRAYRLLGLHPGPDFTTPAAASLTALPLAQAQALLTELAQANLLTETGEGRYAFHDLIRDHAADLARNVDSDDDRHTATQRVLDHYLHTAHQAALRLEPYRRAIDLPLDDQAVTVSTLSDLPGALAWLQAEATTLVALVHQCGDQGWDDWCWQLAWTLSSYLDRQGHWRTWAKVQQLALEAAKRGQQRQRQAESHRALARAWTRLGDYDEARAQFAQALEMFNAMDDMGGLATTYKNLGFFEARLGRRRVAVEHNLRALDCHRLEGNSSGEADALNNIGWCLAQLGELDQAFHRCLQALRLYRTLGSGDGEANAWDSLGYISFVRGRHPSAAYCLHRALDYYTNSGDNPHDTAQVHAQLADNHRAVNELEPARTHYRHALVLLEQLEHHDADDVRRKLRECETELDHADATGIRAKLAGETDE